MKRFTETNKWDDPWFIRLPIQDKLLWLYICDRCDASGVIEFSHELASVQIGHKVTEDELTRFGESRVDMLPNGKWQIVKFLKFQYGTVDANCPAHKPVIRLIAANGLRYPINNLPDRVVDRVSGRVSNTLQEKEKDKEKGYKRGSTEGEIRGDVTYSKPKQKAPIYDKLPPKRIPTDEEFAKAQQTAKEETHKLRQHLKP